MFPPPLVRKKVKNVRIVRARTKSWLPFLRALSFGDATARAEASAIKRRRRQRESTRSRAEC